MTCKIYLWLVLCIVVHSDIIWYGPLNSTLPSNWISYSTNNYIPFLKENCTFSTMNGNMTQCCGVQLNACWSINGQSEGSAYLYRNISTFSEYKNIQLQFGVHAWKTSESVSGSCFIYSAANNFPSLEMIGNYEIDDGIIYSGTSAGTIALGSEYDASSSIFILLYTNSLSPNYYCFWSQFYLIGTKITSNPTSDPTKYPTLVPTISPTIVPTDTPSILPTSIPSLPPSTNPTMQPTGMLTFVCT